MMKLPLSGINFNNQAAVEAKRTSMQEELRTLLDTWEHENENNDWDVNPILKRIAEILEEAINDFMQQNPDPMDDRHPLKSQPLRPLGHLLKMITRIDSFVNRLVISYLLARDNTERNVLAARLMLNLLPGIDTNVVLADADSLLTKLYQWAEHSDSRELRAYSMALLGAAMGAEQAHQYRQNNIALIPIALQRLRELYAQMIEDYKKANEEQDMARKHTVGPTNFAQLRQEEEKRQEAHAREEQRQAHAELIRDDKIETTPIRKRHSEANGLSPPPKRSVSLSCMPQGTVSAMVSPSIDSVIRNAGSPFREAWNIINGSAEAGSSNSSWRQTMQPILIGTHCLYPLSIEMEQRLILHYLGPTSEYQDNVSILLEHHALDVVLNYLAMDVDGHSHICRDIRLLFDAIRYISSLLIHRKFAWEFVAAQGIQRLLRINRQSLALTAVATCLYYLAYSTDIINCRN